MVKKEQRMIQCLLIHVMFCQNKTNDSIKATIPKKIHSFHEIVAQFPEIELVQQIQKLICPQNGTTLTTLDVQCRTPAIRPSDQGSDVQHNAIAMRPSDRKSDALLTDMEVWQLETLTRQLERKMLEYSCQIRTNAFESFYEIIPVAKDSKDVFLPLPPTQSNYPPMLEISSSSSLPSVKRPTYNELVSSLVFPNLSCWAQEDFDVWFASAEIKTVAFECIPDRFLTESICHCMLDIVSFVLNKEHDTCLKQHCHHGLQTIFCANIQKFYCAFDDDNLAWISKLIGNVCHYDQDICRIDKEDVMSIVIRANRAVQEQEHLTGTIIIPNRQEVLESIVKTFVSKMGAECDLVDVMNPPPNALVRPICELLQVLKMEHKKHNQSRRSARNAVQKLCRTILNQVKERKRTLQKEEKSNSFESSSGFETSEIQNQNQNHESTVFQDLTQYMDLYKVLQADRVVLFLLTRASRTLRLYAFSMLADLFYPTAIKTQGIVLDEEEWTCLCMGNGRIMFDIHDKEMQQRIFEKISKTTRCRHCHKRTLCYRATGGHFDENYAYPFSWECPFCYVENKEVFDSKHDDDDDDVLIESFEAFAEDWS